MTYAARHGSLRRLANWLFSRKTKQKMLSTKTAVIIITLVLSVDNFGDWATPKKTPTGLFYFYRCRFRFHILQPRATNLFLLYFLQTDLLVKFA
jgi:hypothetical protein